MEPVIEQTTETTESQQTEETTEQGDAKDRIQQLTKELDAEKESKDLLQQNIALMRANAPQQQQVEQFDIYKHVGLDPEDPEDVPNQKQLKAIVGHIQGRYRDEISQLRFKIDHPDYSEIVGTEEQLRAGQFAEPIKEAIKANPALIATIQSSAQPQMAAYSIAKLYQQNKVKGQQTTKTEAQNVIDQAVKNANKVKTSSNTKGGTALTGESRYEAMTDDEFVALAIKNGANF
jgi:hypothetical protein